MSKKARKGASARTKSTAQREAERQAELQEAERLLRRKRPQEALAVLQQQEQLYPNDEEMLALLVNTCLDLNDLQGYQCYAERLLPMRANDPDLLLALAGAYSSNRRTLHISEFENLCISYIQMGLAKKDRALVEGWLRTWETVDPDSETYRLWQARVKLKLFRMGR